MRENRIKFKEIEELRQWISLLISERDHNQDVQSTELSKINSGEFAENDFSLFAVTKDELMQRIKHADEDINVINRMIISKKVELRLLFKKKKEVVDTYNMYLLGIKWKTNKTETKDLSVGNEVLGRTINNIKASRNDISNKLEVLFNFSDDSIYTLGIGLDKVISYNIYNF